MSSKFGARWAALHASLAGFLRRRTRVASRRSLVGRLLALLVIGVVAIYLVAAIGLWWVAGAVIEESLRQQGKQWLAELDVLGTPLYSARDRRQAMERIGKRLAQVPEIGYVRYYDAGGEQVLGELPKGGQFPAMTAELRAQAEAAGKTAEPYVSVPVSERAGFVRLVAPVRVRLTSSDGMFGFSLDAARRESVKVIGYIDLGLDLGYYRGHFVRSVVIGIVIIAAVFVLALVLWRRLMVRALAPLAAMQEAVARIAQGDTSVTVDASRDRELAAIGEALNATVSALREREEALQLAQLDPVTGLIGRANFLRELEQECIRLTATRGTSAVLFVDLDHFKYVNDTAGHAAGDQLLAQVGAMLRSRLRERDLVSRFGGDEFLVLARNIAREGAEELAGAIVTMMQESRFKHGEQSFSIHCSVGVALVEPDYFAPEEVIGQADLGCRQAKAAGRNAYRVYQAGDADREGRSSAVGWAQWIRTALRDDRFRLVYQPIVALASASGEERYEALLRLPAQDGQLVSPAAFMSVAERFGLQADIDHWVIRRAVAGLGELRRAGRAATLHVNLAGRSFDSPQELVMVVREALEREQVPGSALVLELAEHSVVRHVNEVRQVIEALAINGCGFALDDFGVGLGSLSYVRYLPVTHLKITGTFVQQMAQDPLNQAMVGAIVQVARVLGKQTVAQCVQDRGTLELLGRLGVDFAQGFYLGGPQDAPRSPLSGASEPALPEQVPGGGATLH